MRSPGPPSRWSRTAARMPSCRWPRLDQRLEGMSMTHGTDAGLLTPVRAGTPIEQIVDDESWLRAMLDAEAALARAQARLGTVPGPAAEVITEVARIAPIDVVGLAHRSRNAANPVVA